MFAAGSPSQTKPLSDLVLDYHLDASFSDGFTTHVRVTAGRTAAQRRVQTTEKWERVRKLGHGGHGTVWKEKLVQDDPSQETTRPPGKPTVRAVKKIRMGNLLAANFLHRELEALAKFSHDKFASSFIRVFGWFEIGENLFIAMEYLRHGDLQGYAVQPFPEFEVKQITIQVLEALQAMHKEGFTHRDVKPANILVVCKGPAWYVKLGDFGISKRVSESTVLDTHNIGTRGYMAPEMLGIICPDEPLDTTQLHQYSSAVDIWAVGEISHRLLTNQPTFISPISLGLHIARHMPFPREALASVEASQGSVDFIMKTMATSASKRPTAQAALEQPWLVDHEFLEGGESDSGSESSVHEALPEASARWTTDPVQGEGHPARAPTSQLSQPSLDTGGLKTDSSNPFRVAMGLAAARLAANQPQSEGSHSSTSSAPHSIRHERRSVLDELSAKGDSLVGDQRDISPRQYYRSTSVFALDLADHNLPEWTEFMDQLPCETDPRATDFPPGREMILHPLTSVARLTRHKLVEIRTQTHVAQDDSERVVSTICLRCLHHIVLRVNYSMSASLCGHKHELNLSSRLPREHLDQRKSHWYHILAQASYQCKNSECNLGAEVTLLEPYIPYEYIRLLLDEERTERRIQLSKIEEPPSRWVAAIDTTEWASGGILNLFRYLEDLLTGNKSPGRHSSWHNTSRSFSKRVKRFDIVMGPEFYQLFRDLGFTEGLGERNNDYYFRQTLPETYGNSPTPVMSYRGYIEGCALELKIFEARRRLAFGFPDRVQDELLVKEQGLFSAHDSLHKALDCSQRDARDP